MSKINKEAVEKALGNSFSLTVHDNGNIQARIAKLSEVGPFDVCCRLVQGAQALRKAGLIDNPNDAVRLSWKTDQTDRNGKAIWQPYPQIWINQPKQEEAQPSQSTAPVASTQDTSRLDALESVVSNMASGIQMLLQQNTKPAGQQTMALPVAPKEEQPVPVPEQEAPPF